MEPWVSAGRPIPDLRSNAGWRDVPIAPREEPLVAVAGIGGRVGEDPAYLRMGVHGALPGCWVREGVAERLARAADSLPAGLSLVVWDGYRPIAIQRALYEGFLASLRATHAAWDEETLAREAARYVTPPSTDPGCPPPHLTGGAVDLTLAGPDGRLLDMGTDFDAFVPEAGARSLELMEGPATENRRILFWAMHDAGFTAYSEEWWHFDHGDQFWGLVTGRTAVYGPADWDGPGA